LLKKQRGMADPKRKRTGGEHSQKKTPNAKKAPDQDETNKAQEGRGLCQDRLSRKGKEGKPESRAKKFRRKGPRLAGGGGLQRGECFGKNQPKKKGESSHSGGGKGGRLGQKKKSTR